ncbi:MAG TPA: pilus assembly protein TadG-related protein [Hyphomicrobiaceae bacterium]|nr:pilus assembly protein TadG-related protein [Hyphomicrobiaceae bacterium]
MQRLAKDGSGAVGMMFGLLVIPVAASIGLAVDFGRVYAVNNHTQAALDAAALAAGRVSQLEKVDTVVKASAAADAYFATAKPSNVVKSSLEFSPNSLNTEFKVTATSWVRTPFLGILNALKPRDSEAGAPAVCQGNFYACVRVVTTATAALCPSSACAVGGGGNNSKGESLEISLMLDLTGSMCDPCTKIDDLKSAAKDLVDIVIWDDQSAYSSRVALSPFAPAVNVGSYFTQLTNKSDRTDNDGSSSKNIHYPSSCIKDDGSVKRSCRDDSDYNAPPYIAAYAKCVVERGGSEQYSDAAPAAGAWLPTWNDKADSMSKSCSPTAKIVPLSKNRTALKEAIDAFGTGGTTAGQLGTAFAWYMLSPNWANIWPADSKPAAYGTAKLRKIAVLMTDGVYNTLQAHSYGDNSSQADTAQSQAVELCSKMKDKSIEIYTVGFKLDNDKARTMLSKCATSSDHNYSADNGDQLKQAFRDIALKIAFLRLTN